jgi:hypothetical protein
MRRNADGASDLFAPMEIGEEVLAEALASHGWNSVARGGDGCRFEACLAKNQSTLRGEIFVDFELRAVVSSGRSTVPSRAYSAA